MSQLSLYLDSETISKLSTAAEESSLSLSRYVARVVDEHFSAKENADLETWKTLQILYDSAEPDETFVEPPDIPWELGSDAESFR